MDVYWVFFKLLVSTVVTLVEAAIVLFGPAVTHRPPAMHAQPRLVLAAARTPAMPDVRALAVRLASADPAERVRAACALADMEGDAAPAVPALAKMLGDATRVDARNCDEAGHRRRRDEGTTTPGESAAAALASIGRPAFDALMQAAHSAEWFARKNAIWALGTLDDARAVPTVAAALRDPEAAVRRNAAWSLGALDAEGAGAALIQALRDADPETRANAAWALGAIDDRRAVDALGGVVVSDTDRQVRANAAWALGAIGDPHAADALAAALKDRDAEVRRQAAWALGVIQP